MKIYLASSWRNSHQPLTLEVLRGAGHEVYDFRNPAPGNTGFHWSDIEHTYDLWGPQEFRQGLDHPIANRGFANDWNAMRWADAGVLLLPSGRSAHIEAGYFVGACKPLIIYIPPCKPEELEPELMYKMSFKIVTGLGELLEACRHAEGFLKGDVDAPWFQLLTGVIPWATPDEEQPQLKGGN